MRIIIKNAKILDPFNGISKQASLIINDGFIHSVLDSISDKDLEKSDLLISGENRVVFPALFDMHTHLREPGGEYKETIKTGTMAALHGGYTKVTAFPNTKPVLDDVESLKKLLDIIKRDAEVEVFPVPSISIGLQGKDLTDFEALKKEGLLAFTDDGKGVQDPYLFIEALKKAHDLNLLFLIHPEDEKLTFGGVIHQGIISEKLGLKGLSSEAEESMISRDIVLAKQFKARVHFCHVSTAYGVELIKGAQSQGLKVSGEMTPHHLCFSDEMIKSAQDADMKMNPPLRSEKDRKALVKALEDGAIKIIATDHAPHSLEEKSKGIKEAPFGIIGLETAIPLLYDYLVLKEGVPFYKIISALTKGPADIFGLEEWGFKIKKNANFVIFNTEKESFLDEEFFFSKSSNFPLKNVPLKGKVEYVFYDNKLYDFGAEEKRLIKRSLITGELI